MFRAVVLVATGLAGLALAAGCASVDVASPQEARMLTVKGNLTYVSRIALPGDTRAVVEVRDAALPEGPVVAEQRIDLRGRQVPIPFELAVERAKLAEGRSYTVRGGLLVAGRPAWVSDPVPLPARSGVVDLGALTMKPIRVGAFPTSFQCGDLRATIDFLDDMARLTVGQTSFELRQTRTASGARYEAVDDPTTWFWNKGRGGTLSVKGRTYPECVQITASSSDLHGTEWVVEDINGGGIIDRSRATLVFGADGRLKGRGSCNTYMARYAAADDTVTIAEVAGTMMACSPALMQQESRFFEVLRDVRRYEFRADGALVLHTDDRRTILARRARS